MKLLQPLFHILKKQLKVMFHYMYYSWEYDHNSDEANWCNFEPFMTSLGTSEELQDSYGFRAHLKRMLKKTIDKYALRKVEIQTIEFGDIVHSVHSGLYHLCECEISVSYKQDQIRRYEYDRRAVPLAIAFRKTMTVTMLMVFLVYHLEYKMIQFFLKILCHIATRN